MTFQIDASTIQAESLLFSRVDFFPLTFKPYIDDFNSDPFLPKEPWAMIESGDFSHVPLIIGNTQAQKFHSLQEVFFSIDDLHFKQS